MSTLRLLDPLLMLRPQVIVNPPWQVSISANRTVEKNIKNSCIRLKRLARSAFCQQCRH
jgi:hypothetical protein